MNIILAIITIILSGILVYKAYAVRDVSIIGSAIPRLLLGGFLLFPDLTSNTNLNLTLFIIIIFASDLIVNTLRWVSKKGLTYGYHRAAIKTLLAIESRYKAIIENTIVGIYVIDCKGNFLYINDRALELFGISETESNHLTIFSVLKNGSTLLSLVEKCVAGKLDEIVLYTEAILVNKNIIVVGKTSINGSTTITGIVIEGE